MTYENILVETRGNVGLITLNRPKALNALSAALVREMGAALVGIGRYQRAQSHICSSGGSRPARA